MPKSFAEHQGCILMDCDFIGTTRSCIAKIVEELATFISQPQLRILLLSLDNLSTSKNIEEAIVQNFSTLPDQYDDAFYSRSQLRIKQFHNVVNAFCCLHNLEDDFTFCLSQHDTLSSSGAINKIFHNLHRVEKYILDMKSNLETSLFYILDLYPDIAEKNLRLVMNLMEKSHSVKLPYISPRNFKTLGIKQWVDDEVINYFVMKWCSKSQTTLGLNTWFACKFLFQGNLCNCARTGILTFEDESGVRKWCRTAEKAQSLAQWERVFIPINENNAHWYSACIDFRSKKIEIYDSLADRCFINRRRPVQSRKNTSVMLVLMWLTEVLGRMRGEEVLLYNNPATVWRCDPHTQVPFQPNSYDCGIHTLWHLQHVLEFGSVERNCQQQILKFSSNMTGKRLRLAQEMLDDCEL